MKQSNLSRSTIASASLILAFTAFLSKILGLLRDRLLASHFGTGATLDAYQISFLLPDFIYNLFILGALSAAFRDHRFPELEKEELGQIKIEISLLSRLSPVLVEEIKPWKHGVVVSRDGKSGLFLPQVWEQIPDKESFLGELCQQKAGLPRDCWKDLKTRLYSFSVDAFHE